MDKKHCISNNCKHIQELRKKVDDQYNRIEELCYSNKYYQDEAERLREQLTEANEEIQNLKELLNL